MECIQGKDEVTDFEWMVLQIEDIEGCSVTKARVMDVLRAQTGKVLRFTKRALVRPQQLRRARQLLDSGLSVLEVRDALVPQLGCSQRTAYRVIAAALRQRGRERAARMAQAQGGLF